MTDLAAEPKLGFLYLLGLTRLFSRKPPVMSFSEAEPEVATVSVAS